MAALRLSAPRASNASLRGALLTLAGLSLAACASTGSHYPAPAAGETASGNGAGKPFGTYGTSKPYQVNGQWYTPRQQPDYDEVGTASWYGQQFHNHTTSDGEVFDMNAVSAAHKTLPLPSMVEVTNLANGRRIVVRVNDRGPFVDGRIIDMSRAAAQELGFYAVGTARVRVRYVGPAPDLPKIYQAVVKPAPATDPGLAKFETASAKGAVLGPEIGDSVPRSPSNVSWDGAARPVAVAARPAPAPPPRPPVQVAAAAPPPSLPDVDSLLSDLDEAPPRPAPTPAMSGPAMASAVQTGAYASRANAERAAAQAAGQAQIVPVQQSGRVLYKVMVALPQGAE